MDKAHTPTPPRGYKPIAWEGVGLYVPQRWELGRRSGNHRQGWFRVDTEQRMAAQIKWWTIKRPVGLEEIASQHIQEVFGRDARKRVKPRKIDSLKLPTADGDRATAFSIDPGEDKPAETLIIWERPAIKRIAVFRILRTPLAVPPDMLQTLVSGMLLQGLETWRTWSVLDFVAHSPPRFQMATAGLAAGICYMRFEYKRASIALRRFSAADAVLNCESPTLADVRIWCKVIYAAEFHDMRYEIEEGSDPCGRPKLRLTARPRLLAPIELSWLIPKHRRLPKIIDIIWDPDANKIYSIEIRQTKHLTDDHIETFERSVQMTLDHDALQALPSRSTRKRTEKAGDGDASWQERQRSLEARVSVSTLASQSVDEAGRVHVVYPYRRSQQLRVLRFLSGNRAGEEMRERELELDMIGSVLWRECDGKNRVCDLVAMVERRFQISYREAEQSVVEYVRNLGNRGLLELKMDEPS